jgi:DNA-binding NarL/FixJ family response regulator
MQVKRKILRLTYPERSDIHERNATHQSDGRRRSSPDLVLVNWDLSGQGLREKMGQLRGMTPRAKLIVLSVRPEAESPALAAGADAFIVMNSSPDGLRPFQRDKYTLHDHLCLEWLEALPTPVWLLFWKSLMNALRAVGSGDRI